MARVSLSQGLSHVSTHEWKNTHQLFYFWTLRKLQCRVVLLLFCLNRGIRCWQQCFYIFFTLVFKCWTFWLLCNFYATLCFISCFQGCGVFCISSFLVISFLCLGTPGTSRGYQRALLGVTTKIITILIISLIITHFQSRDQECILATSWVILVHVYLSLHRDRRSK